MPKIISSRLILASLVSAVLFCSAGKCNSGDSDCTHEALVQDMSDLDGCGLMFILNDGKKLLPSDLADYQDAIMPGDTVRISYEIIEGMASICMAEDHIVRLSCLEIISKQSIACPRIIDPFKPEWSFNVMKAVDPYRVERMTIDGMELYHYIGKKECRIYSCLGEPLCNYVPGETDPCRNILVDVIASEIIYVQDQTP